MDSGKYFEFYNSISAIETKIYQQINDIFLKEREKWMSLNTVDKKPDNKNSIEPKQHKCKFCFKTYKSYNGKYMHVQAKHLNKKYTCQMCCKQFSQNFHLQRHIKNVHKTNKN